MEYEVSMEKNGITAPEIKKYVLPDPTNWEAVALVYENLEVVPTPQNYRSFHERIGTRGLALAQGPNSASPMHSILHMLMPMEAFFYAYMDVPDELHKLAERMTPFYDRILDVMCECDAEVVWWGANYDQSTTWPPFFATEIVPYVRMVGDRLRAVGKFMASHCDGENDKLLEYMPTARFDIAESVPTEPMVKRSLKELREGFGEPTTVWGGLPAVAFMDGPMSGRLVRGPHGPGVRRARVGQAPHPRRVGQCAARLHSSTVSEGDRAGQGVRPGEPGPGRPALGSGRARAGWALPAGSRTARRRPGETANMETARRAEVPVVRLPGRDIQRIIGKEAAIASGRMTVGTARYSDVAGPMAPHQHAEECIVVLEARGARVRYGPAPDDLPTVIDLEAGLVLHIPELEWHVFEWDAGGYADCLVIYGQVDNIRPEDIQQSQPTR